MQRKITYFVNDNEVTEERYNELLHDENNLSTLTIKYETVDVDYLLKEIDSLKKKITELENEKNNNWWIDKIKNPWSTSPWTTNPNIDDDWWKRPLTTEVPWPHSFPQVTYCYNYTSTTKDSN